MKKRFERVCDFLLEVGTEEIPARFLSSCVIQMKELFTSTLRSKGICFREIKTYGTLRRLVVFLKGVKVRREIKEVEIIGPPERIAYEGGKPTDALKKFLLSKGGREEDVKIVEREKKRYVALRIKEGGEDIKPFLRDACENVLKKLSFPKTMRWDGGNERFARPVRWILCLFGKKVFPLTFAGINSKNKTSSHPHNGKTITVKSPEDYFLKVEKNGVMLSIEKRVEEIKRTIRKFEEKLKAKCLYKKEDLEEVGWMLENPAGILCSIDERFLSLPVELLEVVLRKGLKAFIFVNERGDIIPKALFFADSPLKKRIEENVRRGVERVIRSRLEDGEFYMKEDMKHPLSFFLEKLKEINFGDLSGSMWERKERIKTLLFELSPPGIEREEMEEAGTFMDFDITTNLVSEFPELHGIVGRIYAEKNGLRKSVAMAIEEHIYPRFSGDRLPESPLGVFLSICDRVDSICGHFKAGHKPTGDADPFGVRRDALGIAEIVWAHSPSVDVEKLVQLSSKLYNLDAQTSKEILSFIVQRMESVLERKCGKDLAEACFLRPYNPQKTMRKIEALKKFIHSDLLQTLARIHKRFNNMVGENSDTEVSPELFTEEAEREFWKNLNSLENFVREKIISEDYEGIIRELSGLENVVNRFFKEVFVMVEDERVRRNRLNLLTRAKFLFTHIADFSKFTTLEGGEYEG